MIASGFYPHKKFINDSTYFKKKSLSRKIRIFYIWNSVLVEFVYAFALVLSIILCIAKKKGLITFLDGTSISNNEESCEQKLADAAVFAVKGRRATMEDRFALIQVPIPHLVDAPVVRIFAVLDGHGGQVSRNCSV